MHTGRTGFPWGVVACCLVACTAGEDGSASRDDAGSEAGATGGGGGNAAGGAAGTGGAGTTGGAVSTSGVPGTSGGAGGSAAGGAGTSGGSPSAGAGGALPGTGGSGTTGTISAAFPNDVGIASDPRVLFHSGFESDFDGWTSHTSDPSRLDVLSDGLAQSGSNYLRAQVTRTMLAQDQYISAQAQHVFSRRVPQTYFRFYARFVGQTAHPHHWVRIAAGDATFQSDGLANTVPEGDRGFWFDVDARDDGFFNFYVYWYLMRSGRCNDGTAVPGCAGDQGSTYYYGNNFTPAGQSPFPRDEWFCLEIFTKTNTVGESDGELALWMNDALVGEYKPGTPRGRWLRDNFYSWGQYFQDEQAFEGFEFRSSEDVLMKRITLDAYYERGTLDPGAPEAQVILYDDVVVATERIGCQVR